MTDERDERRGRILRHVARSFWTVLHDVIAHPVCGVLWILGAKRSRPQRSLLERAGDWLHEATLPPMGWSDVEYLRKRGVIEVSESSVGDPTND